MTVEPLSTLDRTTLRERALEALRAAITSGQYRPGDHLGEVELAQHLGVSRGTVREALRHLQQEGLVTPGNRGMLRVKTLCPKEIRELYEVRAALEGLAVADIIASPEREASVRTLRQALAELADPDADFTARVNADLDFHSLLCQLAGNSMLVESWSHLEVRIRIAIIHAGPDRAPRMMSQDRHSPIVDAIETGDVSAAMAVVTEHMRTAADHFSHD